MTKNEAKAVLRDVENNAVYEEDQVRSWDEVQEALKMLKEHPEAFKDYCYYDSVSYDVDGLYCLGSVDNVYDMVDYCSEPEDSYYRRIFDVINNRRKAHLNIMEGFESYDDVYDEHMDTYRDIDYERLHNLFFYVDEDGNEQNYEEENRVWLDDKLIKACAGWSFSDKEKIDILNDYESFYHDSTSPWDGQYCYHTAYFDTDEGEIELSVKVV